MDSLHSAYLEKIYNMISKLSHRRLFFSTNFSHPELILSPFTEPTLATTSSQT